MGTTLARRIPIVAIGFSTARIGCALFMAWVASRKMATHSSAGITISSETLHIMCAGSVKRRLRMRPSVVRFTLAALPILEAPLLLAAPPLQLKLLPNSERHEFLRFDS